MRSLALAGLVAALAAAPVFAQSTSASTAHADKPAMGMKDGKGGCMDKMKEMDARDPAAGGDKSTGMQGKHGMQGMQDMQGTMGMPDKDMGCMPMKGAKEEKPAK